MIAAIILSAGFGSRLRPLTDEVPKPLVPVGDAPSVLHIERALAAAGCSRIVVNTHHRPEAFRGVPFAPGTALVHEATLLGTAGGVQNARDALGPGPVLVWNGDILASIDVPALLAAAAPDLDAVWMVARRPRGEGTVGLDGAGRVVRVRGFRGGDEASGGDFLGISWLSGATVRGLPREGCLIGDVLGPALQRGARIGSVTHDGPWDDLGSPASYLEANLRWLRDRGKNVYLGASAVAPPGTTGVLGRGAILRGAPGRDVVLWPGAEASSLPPRSIVTTAGRIVTVP